MANCEAKISLRENFISATRLNNDIYFNNSKLLQKIMAQNSTYLSQWWEFLADSMAWYRDFIDKLWWDKSDMYKEWKKWLHAFVSVLANAKGKNWVYIFNNAFTDEVNLIKIANKVPGFGKFFEWAEWIETMKFMKWTKEFYESYWYDFQKMCKFLNEWDFFRALFSDDIGAMRLWMVNELPLSSMAKNFKEVQEDFVNIVKKDLMDSWITIADKDAKRLVSDIAGEWLITGKLAWAGNLIREARELYTMWKFTFNTGSAPLMLINACIMWTNLYLWKRKGISVMVNHPLVDYLLKEQKLLWEQSIWAANAINFSEWMWDTLIWRLINKLSISKELAWIIRWWQHQLFDLIAKPSAKRLAISQALSAFGITDKNADEMLKKIMSWEKLNPTFYNEMVTRAEVNYKNFFTQSNSLALSRNRFSRWMCFNVLQWYMMTRSANVLNAVHQWRLDIAKWVPPIKALLNPSNTDMIDLIGSILTTAKISIYADQILNPDEDSRTRTKYFTNLNDYISSLTGNFFARFVKWFTDSVGSYKEYIDATGKPISFIEWIEAWTFWMASVAIQNLFKEFNVFMPAMKSIKTFNDIWFGKDWSLWLIIDAYNDEMERVMNWLWRFTLLPWLDPYEYEVIKQPDDWFNKLIFAFGDNNENVKMSLQSKNLADVERLMRDKGFFERSWNLVSQLPVIKHFMAAAVDPALSSALSYKKYTQSIDNDPIMKNLFEGKFDNRILNNPDTATSLRKDLVALDLSMYSTDKNLKTAMSEFGLNEVKEEAFMKLLANKMWDKQLQALINWAAPDIKSIQLAKIAAFAENNVNGSSRILLSYIANKYYNIWKTKVVWNKYWKVTEEDDLNIKGKIIAALYPNMYIADKLSWKRLMDYRQKEIMRWVFKPTETLVKAVDKLIFDDLIIHSEAKRWNPNAQYIKNAINTSASWVADNADRLKLMEHTMSSIDWLHFANNDVKSMLRLWVLAANMDNINNILNDDAFVAARKDDVQRILDITFGTVDWINQTATNFLSTESGYKKYPRKAHAKSYPYWLDKSASYSRPSSYTPQNNKVYDEVSSKMPKVIDRIPSYYKPSNTITYPYNPYTQYQKGIPQDYNLFLKFSDQFEAKKAESENLVTGYVNKSPWEWIDKITQKYGFKAIKYVPLTKNRIKIQPPKYLQSFTNEY